MGLIRQPCPVMLFVAAFSRHETALQWALDRCVQSWGPCCHASPVFRFDQTTFYRKAMGDELRKVLWVFEPLVDAADLPEWKHQTNAWELECASTGEFPEARPLNLDPGYLTQAKLVLATTKDRDHRIYLQRGIYAENTLYYYERRWKCRPWTYPDYQTSEYHEFLTECRDLLRNRLADAPRDSV